MKLPVISVAVSPSPGAMWRQFVDLAVDHAMAAGEEVPIAGGRLVVGDDAASKPIPGLAIIADHDSAATSVIEILAACCDSAVPPPRFWTMQAEVSALQAIGMITVPSQMWRLTSASAKAMSPAELLVLPIRAARPAYERSTAERAAIDPAAGLLPRHLDDPQYDAFIALRDGIAIGTAGLQSRGNTGLVCDVFTRPANRRHGIADQLLHRVIEAAARSQFSDVYAAAPANTAAASLLRRAGFSPVVDYFDHRAASSGDAFVRR